MTTDNLLKIPKPIQQLSDYELEEERLKILADQDNVWYNHVRYKQLVNEIVLRMFKIED